MLRFLAKPTSAARQDGAGGSGYAPFWQRLMPALRRRAIAGNALEHLGSLPLTAQSSLALVRLQGETLLLGVTSQNITLLAKGNDGAAGGQPPIELRELASR